MSYGSSSYGSAAYGGLSGSSEQVFFQFALRDPDVLFEARANFNGPEEFYSIFVLQGSEATAGPAGIIYKIYTLDHEGASPQLQATQEGNGQSVVGAKPIIIVTAEIDGVEWSGGLNFSVKGRPGD